MADSMQQHFTYFVCNVLDDTNFVHWPCYIQYSMEGACEVSIYQGLPLLYQMPQFTSVGSVYQWFHCLYAYVHSDF